MSGGKTKAPKKPNEIWNSILEDGDGGAKHAPEPSRDCLPIAYPLSEHPDKEELIESSIHARSRLMGTKYHRSHHIAGNQQQSSHRTSKSPSRSGRKTTTTTSAPSHRTTTSGRSRSKSPGSSRKKVTTTTTTTRTRSRGTSPAGRLGGGGSGVYFGSGPIIYTPGMVIPPGYVVFNDTLVPSASVGIVPPLLDAPVVAVSAGGGIPVYGTTTYGLGVGVGGVGVGTTVGGFEKKKKTTTTTTRTSRIASSGGGGSSSRSRGKSPSRIKDEITSTEKYQELAKKRDDADAQMRKIRDKEYAKVAESMGDCEPMARHPVDLIMQQQQQRKKV